MADRVLKVALLARAGDAREQLRRALGDLGAELVVEADPNEVDALLLRDCGAGVVLFSVEPATEAALDRLEETLLDPRFSVLIDEAATTARLDGWDLNRWARHLAAKLLGRDVLPPGAEQEHAEAADHLRPGIASTHVLALEPRLQDFAAEVEAGAEQVPVDEGPGHADFPLAGAPEAASAPPPLPSPTAGFDVDLAAVEAAMVAADPAPAAVEAAGGSLVALETGAHAGLELDEAIDLRGLELVDDEALAAVEPGLGGERSREAPVPAMLSLDVEELQLSEAELAAFGEFTERPRAGGADLDGDFATLSGDDADLSFEAGEREFDVADEEPVAVPLDADGDFARLEAAFDAEYEARAVAPVATEPPPIPDFDFAEGPLAAAPAPEARDWLAGSRLALSESTDAAAPAAPAPAEASARFDLSALSLAPLDDAPALAPSKAEPVAAPERLAAASGLSLAPLADDAGPPAEAGPVVLVLSGIGGPDALRQLVRALPLAFPPAVLLVQQLDGGRHDRLVEQLAKISRLPVVLASESETPPPGQVRVLPDGARAVGVLPVDGGPATLVDAVATRGGAVVVLSGADPALVPALVAAMGDGLRVFVQDPASCFDAKAAEALRAAGAPAIAAQDLAARLDASFPSE